MVKKILLGLLFILLLTVLELNKNSLWGWALFIAISAGYFLWRGELVRTKASAAVLTGVFFAAKAASSLFPVDRKT